MGAYKGFDGSVAQYKSLHKWVNQMFGKPNSCERCSTTTAKRYDWATIDNKYTFERSDWERLCRSCHIKSDGRINQLNKGGGENRVGWQHSEQTKDKMKANHWSTRRAWKPRERNEHGRFV